MKKIAEIMIFAALALCCSCSESINNEVGGTGTASFERFDIVYDDVSIEMPTKATEEAGGSYIVEITNANDDVVYSGTYSQVKAMSSGVELAAGSYTLNVRSMDLPMSVFSTPVYGATNTFSVKVGQTTVLNPVTCTVLQTAATVSYSEDLLEMMTGNGTATVEVVSGYPLSYELTKSGSTVSYDKRIGYFSVPDGSTTMVVTFVGNVNGSKQKMTKTFTDVKAKELRAITFIKKVSVEGEVSFDVVINTYIQDAELVATYQAGMLDVIGTDPDAPKGDGGMTLDFASDCTMYDDLENIVVTPTGSPFDLRLVATVPNGVKKLKVNIESTSKGFDEAVAAAGGPVIDLVNPSEASAVIFQVVPFPHGQELVGQTSINFDLSSAQDAINLFPGEHTFTMQMTDAKSCSKNIKIKMIVNE